MDTPLPLPPLASVRQVAALLRITERSVTRLLRRGAFPSAFRLVPSGKSPWHIPKKDLEAYMSRRVAS
jgi:predicted DNA-binding transcriptional regulator AlpA